MFMSSYTIKPFPFSQTDFQLLWLDFWLPPRNGSNDSQDASEMSSTHKLSWPMHGTINPMPTPSSWFHATNHRKYWKNVSSNLWTPSSTTFLSGKLNEHSYRVVMDKTTALSTLEGLTFIFRLYKGSLHALDKKLVVEKKMAMEKCSCIYLSLLNFNFPRIRWSPLNNSPLINDSNWKKAHCKEAKVVKSLSTFCNQSKT